MPKQPLSYVDTISKHTRLTFSKFEEVSIKFKEWENDWRTDNLTNNRQLFNCDNRRIETHQLLITSLHGQ